MKKRPQRPEEILFEKNREAKSNIRSWIGRVSSNRMEKTATVVVPQLVFNTLISKHFREFKKFKAHDEHNECRIGDVVRIHFDKKRSKTKSFIVSQILTPNRTGYEPLWPLERQPPTLSPEKALSPQIYLEHDIYRDDVTGLSSPYIANYTQSAQGTGPVAIRPPKIGSREFHPFDDHFARVTEPIKDKLQRKQDVANAIQAQLQLEQIKPREDAAI
jgi:small subunit ribosomal protein S17